MYNINQIINNNNHVPQEIYFYSVDTYFGNNVTTLNT